MSRAGLSEDLIERKIENSRGNFDTTAQGLIEPKKSGVSDDLIILMFGNGEDEIVIGMQTVKQPSGGIFRESWM